jgi:type I restriction enzyme, S subunit
MTYRISKYDVDKLGHRAEILPGFAFKSDRFTDNPSDIALVKGENVQQGFIDWNASKYWPAADADSCKKFELCVDDIVLAMDRPWVTAGLKWAYIKKDDPKSLLVQRVSRLRSKKGLNQTYLRCLISSRYFSDYIQPIVTGVNVPHISAKQIGDFKIPLPPPPIQRKIAAILSTYDAMVENSRRRIALLEKISEEIYHEWFVRLRFPGHEKLKIIKGVPVGWKEQKFGQFCQLQRGYDLPDANVEPGPYPVIASTSIKTCHSKYKVEPPVITTGRSGSLGEVLFVHTRAWPLNTTLYVKQFFGNSPFLIYFTLKNMKLENFNSGAGVPTLNRNHLSGIQIIVPNKELQIQFDNIVSKLHSQIGLLRNMTENLIESRGRLLPRLISGKLSVEKLDIQMLPGTAEELNSDTADA